VPDPKNMTYDRTEINVSQEIIDLYREMLENIDEFNSISGFGIKNKATVYFIELKLEIFAKSPLFIKILRMQAGQEHTQSIGEEIPESNNLRSTSARLNGTFAFRGAIKSSKTKKSFEAERHKPNMIQNLRSTIARPSSPRGNLLMNSMLESG